MAKISEKWVADGDKIHVIRKHDWNPMLDQAQAYRDQDIDGRMAKRGWRGLG